MSGLRETVFGAAQRAFNGICRGTLVKADDAHKWQQVRVRTEYGYDFSGAEVSHPYGFTSVGKPPADDQTSDAAEVIVVFPDGATSHPIIIQCGDRRYRLQNLAEGEVALHDDQGQKVHLKRASIDIVTPFDLNATVTGTMTLKAQTIVLDSGDIRLGGADASRPVSAIGTVTSDGASDVSNPLNAVKGK